MILDANVISYADVPEWQRRLGIPAGIAERLALLETQVDQLAGLVARVATLESLVNQLTAYWTRVPIYGDDLNLYYLQVEVLDGVPVFSDPVLAPQDAITPAYPGGTYQFVIRGKDDGLPYLITCKTIDGIQTLDVQAATPDKLGLPLWDQTQQKFYSVTVTQVDGVASYEVTQAA